MISFLKLLLELLTKFVICGGKSGLFACFVFILISSLSVSYSLISSSYNNWKTLQGKHTVSLISGSLLGRGHLSWTWTFCERVGSRGGEVELTLHVDSVINLSFSF